MDENSHISCSFCGEENEATSRVCIFCGESLINEDVTFVKSPESEESPSELNVKFLKVKKGTILNDRYLIKRKIGTGGFGTVYFAHDNVLDEDVALKILNPEFSVDSEIKERFLQEIKLARKITHPNVVRIYDINEIQNSSIISMEYFESKNLKELIQSAGTLKFDRAIKIIKQICQALDAAHELNIIHRDIKPHNILVDEEDFIKIVDFGIARNVYRTAEESVTKTGTLIGTPDYMSPEQANGQESDHRSDIYSLGIVIYEMLSSSVPFKSDSPLNTLIQHIQKKHDSIILKNPKVPVWFSDILDKLLEKKPEHRYKNGKEIIEDIETCIKKEKIKKQLKDKVIENMNQKRFNEALEAIQKLKQIAPEDQEIQHLTLKVSKRKREAEFETSQPILKDDPVISLEKKIPRSYNKLILLTTGSIILLFIMLSSFKYYQISTRDSSSEGSISFLFKQGNILYQRCLTTSAREYYFSILQKDPLCTPALIKLIMTYFFDFTMSNFLFARYTLLCVLLIFIISMFKAILNRPSILLYSIPLMLLLINLMLFFPFLQINSALRNGVYKLELKSEVPENVESDPGIHLDIAKTAFFNSKYLDAIVEIENYLMLKPFSISGYYYYYSTYWKDFIGKSDMDIPILSILKFIMLLIIFITSSMLILKF